MAKQKTEKKLSPYTILSKWIFDNNKNSPIPEDIVKDKSIGSHYVLYFFQGSKYQLYISEVFNNFGVYQLDRLEMFKMIKEAARLSGFRPKFIKSYSETKGKLAKELKKKYPYLKYDDVNLLVDHIEQSENRDLIYEMFNLKTPRKYKTKKETLKKGEELKQQKVVEIEDEELEVLNLNSNTWENLMSNFELEEVY